MPTPKRLYPPVIITHPQSETYDEGFERIFGSEPRGPLARAQAREIQAILDQRREEGRPLFKKKEEE